MEGGGRKVKGVYTKKKKMAEGNMGGPFPQPL